LLSAEHDEHVLTKNEVRLD